MLGLCEETNKGCFMVSKTSTVNLTQVWCSNLIWLFSVFYLEILTVPSLPLVSLFFFVVVSKLSFIS